MRILQRLIDGRPLLIDLSAFIRDNLAALRRVPLNLYGCQVSSTRPKQHDQHRGDRGKNLLPKTAERERVALLSKL